MNKKDVIKAVASRTGYTKAVVQDILEEILDLIVEEILKGNYVRFVNFGTFELINHGPRKICNVSTGEISYSTPCKLLKFTPAYTLKELVRHL